MAMDQITKDILALQQIKGVVALLNGEVKYETVVNSDGTSNRRITITYEDRPLLSEHRSPSE